MKVYLQLISLADHTILQLVLRWRLLHPLLGVLPSELLLGDLVLPLED